MFTYTIEERAHLADLCFELSMNSTNDAGRDPAYWRYCVTLLG
jgi:hypothetical protein